MHATLAFLSPEILYTDAHNLTGMHFFAHIEYVNLVYMFER